MTRLGAARRGVAGQGKGCFQRRAGNRSPVQIVAGRGSARHGVAGQGKGCFQRRAGNRSPVQIEVGQGAARQGVAWLGRARAVFSGKGSLFPMQTANMED